MDQAIWSKPLEVQIQEKSCLAIIYTMRLLGVSHMKGHFLSEQCHCTQHTVNAHQKSVQNVSPITVLNCDPPSSRSFHINKSVYD